MSVGIELKMFYFCHLCECDVVAGSYFATLVSFMVMKVIYVLACYGVILHNCYGSCSVPKTAGPWVLFLVNITCNMT